MAARLTLTWQTSSVDLRKRVERVIESMVSTENRNNLYLLEFNILVKTLSTLWKWQSKSETDY